jgi:hypothetical protein
MLYARQAVGRPNEGALLGPRDFPRNRICLGFHELGSEGLAGRTEFFSLASTRATKQGESPMATKRFLGLLLIALLLGSNVEESAAQQIQPRIRTPARPVFHQYEWGPNSHPTYVHVEPHHASTEFEGAARGLGYYYRGLGAGFRDMAEGRVHLAVARRIGLENQKEWLYLHFEAEDLNSGIRRANRDRRSTGDDFARRAKEQRPAPLSVRELAADGSITWPVVLWDARYDADRNSIDAMMRQLAKEIDARQSARTRQHLVAECQTLREKFRERYADVPCHEFVLGVKFLDRLLCELKHPSPVEGREYLALR